MDCHCCSCKLLHSQCLFLSTVVCVQESKACGRTAGFPREHSKPNNNSKEVEEKVEEKEGSALLLDHVRVRLLGQTRRRRRRRRVIHPETATKDDCAPAGERTALLLLAVPEVISSSASGQRNGACDRFLLPIPTGFTGGEGIVCNLFVFLCAAVVFGEFSVRLFFFVFFLFFFCCRVSVAMADSSSFGPAAQEEWSSVVSAEAATRAPPPPPPTITRPLLDLSGAAIGGSKEDHNPTIVLPNQSAEVSHFAIDLGGSLIKLVYFSRAQQEAKTTTTEAESNKKKLEQKRSGFLAGLRRRGGFPILGGRLHFVKFESSKLNDCLAFIKSKRLHRCSNGIEGVEALGATATAEKSSNSSSSPTTTMPEKNGEKNGVIKATGGGAFKYAELFKEKLGVTFDKEDEMQCLVSGANFLLRAIRDEAFTHLEGHKQFVQLDQNELFPYLLVNIGSGVSMIKVDEEGQYERVSGTNVGGGTFWGLGKLLTKCKSFDEILELSQGGDNSAVDMLVGDIYGGLDYSKIGLSASTIASSFGKVIAENKDLSDYRKEDIVLSLLRMISYNIGQVAYLNALRYGLKRIFFSGFFIRGHAYTMDTMSFAIRFWSKGDAQAMFLRHEGFLGALGAFLSYDKYGLANLTSHQCVERFPMGAPYVGGEVHGPPIRDLNEKITWMEKFMQKGIEITAPIPISLPGTTGLGGFERPLARSGSLRSDASAALNVGVLHLDPSLEPFPLLADPKNYEPNTVDLSDQSEREYWLRILFGNLPDLVEKAVASEGGTDDARRRGDAFARAFKAHLARLREEPAAYGKLGLANLLEMREECLREFHFHDVYMAIKERENEAALTVLPDLLAELDSLEPAARMLALIEGVLAANIFDWGSRACVELYHSGTIIEIYRMSRNKMKRPLRVDNFEAFQKKFIGSGGNEGSEKLVPHKRALLFVDNSGADVVLGMLPLARELLRRGTEVVLVANSLPAINDVTAVELPAIVAAAAKHCDTLRRAATAGGLLVDVVGDDGLTEDVAAVPVLTVVENGCGSPCIDFRQVSSELAVIAQDADLMVLEGMGRALHTNYNAHFQCDVLKLAMVKNQRLAEQLLNGSIYDCVCRYEPANYGSSALAN